MSVREHIVIDTRHGGPYDRGMADSYYRRGRTPHYYMADTGSSPRVGYKAGWVQWMHKKPADCCKNATVLELCPICRI